jgi:hypothetical protein
MAASITRIQYQLVFLLNQNFIYLHNVHPVVCYIMYK